MGKANNAALSADKEDICSTAGKVSLVVNIGSLSNELPAIISILSFAIYYSPIFRPLAET